MFTKQLFNLSNGITKTNNMEDLFLEAKGGNVIVRGNMDKDNDLAIETKHGKIFLTPSQTRELIEHLTNCFKEVEGEN